MTKSLVPMRRILLLITDLQIGGTPTVVRELATRLHAPGEVEIEVACLSRWGPVADEIRAAGIAVTTFDAMSPAALPCVVAKLVRLVRRRGIDTVFSFLVHANAVAATASALLPGVRFLQSIQTTQAEPRWHWAVQRAVRIAAETIVVPSRSAARAAIDWAGASPDQVRVIANAVDVSSFDAIYDANANRPAAMPVRLGFIGRLDPIKRVPECLDAVADVPNVRIDIYGDGADRGRVTATIDRLRLGSRATPHGAVPRPHEALSGLDALVLPSSAEGFGLVLIEAMAAGVPVIAVDVPGVRDVVDHRRTGWLMPELTPAAIAAAVAAVTDPARRAALIDAARAEVEARYAWPSILQQYRQVLGL